MESKPYATRGAGINSQHLVCEIRLRCITCRGSLVPSLPIGSPDGKAQETPRPQSTPDEGISSTPYKPGSALTPAPLQAPPRSGTAIRGLIFIILFYLFLAVVGFGVWEILHHI